MHLGIPSPRVFWPPKTLFWSSSSAPSLLSLLGWTSPFVDFLLSRHVLTLLSQKSKHGCSLFLIFSLCWLVCFVLFSQEKSKVDGVVLPSFSTVVTHCRYSSQQCFPFTPDRIDTYSTLIRKQRIPVCLNSHAQSWRRFYILSSQWTPIPILSLTLLCSLGLIYMLCKVRYNTF